MFRPRQAVLALALLGLAAARARGQIDPERRRLLQFGIDKPFVGPAPLGAYAFYYANQPHFIRKDMTLRLALAPVYLDSELGFGRLLPRTDAGIGLSGGGFAESYTEIRQGHYYQEESFTGHGAGFDLSLYPRLNPEDQRIPLYLTLRAGAHPAWYAPRRETAQDFVLPPDHVDYRFRAGLRLGGEPPRLLPGRAAELSFWYQGYFRDRHGGYGYHSDRRLESRTHLAWTRLAMSYRFKSGRQFRVASEAGLSSTPDRIDSYRLGGLLPFSSEFPLSLPGYFNGELSARRYALFGGDYLAPWEKLPSFSTHYFAAAANVAYLPGLGQTDTWNEGLGVGLDFYSSGGILRVETNFAYGVDAIRSGRRGAESLSLLVQLDLEALRKHERPKKRARPEVIKPEGLDWLYQVLRP